MRNFNNSISNPGGLYTGRPQTPPIPPPQYGVIGQESNLPLDFEHAGGNVVAVSFLCVQDAVLFEQKIRLFSTSGANQMQCAIYDKTGPDSGNNLTQSPDTLNFDNSVSILTFTQSKTINNLSNYWFAYQASGSWRFFFDNTPGVFNFGFITAAPFGVFPATFAGIATYEALCQFWGNYVY